MRLGMGLGLGNLLSGQPLTGFPNDFSFNFDGSNDYLEITDTDGLDVGTNDFTFSAWVYLSDASENYILSKGDSTNHYGFRINGNRRISYEFEVSNTNKTPTDDGTQLTLNQWHHVAVVFDRDGSTYRYLDGVNTGTNDVLSGNTGSLSTTDNLNIGRKYSGFHYFDGLIDEVAIWDTALSADDVAKIASKPVDFSKASTYATDRTSNLKLWLRAGDKALPEEDASIARQDFYTDFDATNDFVNVPDNSVLDFGTGDFTITSWFNQTTAQSALVAKGSFGGEGDFLIYDLGDGGSGAGKMIFRNDDNTGQNQFDFTSSTFNNAGWTHIAVTRSGQTITTYTNGSQHATGSIEANYDFSNAHNVSIGAREDGTQRYFGGAISNLSFYKTALDAQTISQFAKSRFTPMRDNRFSVVDFDGSNDYITIGALGNLGSNCTLTFWIKRTNSTGNQFVWDARGASNGGTGYAYFSNGGNLLNIGGGGTSYVDGVQTTTIPVGEWHFVAITGQTLNVNEDFQIARRLNNIEFFNGSISSFAIYNTAKSAEEIYAIYQQGITYDESSLSGLVGYWRMGGDTSKAFPTIADSSSNSNDGTITNGASDDIVQQMVAGYDMGAFESTGEELGAELASGGSWYIGGVSGVTTSKDGITSTVSSDSTGGQAYRPNLNFNTKSGSVYKIVFTPISITGTFNPYINLAGSGDLPTFDASSTATMYFIGNGGQIALNTRSNGGSYTATFTYSLKEVLQSEVSDTFPAIIDVNEPVVGAELVTSITNSSSNPWETFSGSSGNTVSSAINSDGTSGEMYSPEFGMSAGDIIKVTLTITVNSGAILLRFSGTDGTHTVGDLNETINSSGTHTFYAIISGSDRDSLWIKATGADNISNITLSGKKVLGNVGTMTNQASDDLVYSSVLPDQSFLTGVNSAYNFIDLDGSDEYITGSDTIPAFGTNPFSVSIWVNMDSSDLFGLFANAGASSTGDYFFLSISASNYVGTGTSSAFKHKFDSSDTQVGAWALLTYVREGTGTDQSKWYIDGELKDTATDTTNFISTSPWFLGTWRSSSGLSNGKIGQTGIWNKALSATEVSAIYTLGRHGNLLDSYSDNLLSYWAMSALDAKTGLSDVGDGTIYDRSGNSNHGTATNTESADLKSSPNAEPEGYAKGDTNRSTTIP